MAVVQIFRIRLQVDELSKGGRGIIIIHNYQTKLTKLFCPFHGEDKMSLCLHLRLPQTTLIDFIIVIFLLKQNGEKFAILVQAVFVSGAVHVQYLCSYVPPGVCISEWETKGKAVTRVSGLGSEASVEVPVNLRGQPWETPLVSKRGPVVFNLMRKQPYFPLDLLTVSW